MKKWFAVILMLMLSIGAAEVDVESMTFEELIALRDLVEYEINARPESEPFHLYENDYIVGEDIKAGKYWIMMDEWHGENKGYLYVYENSEKGKALHTYIVRLDVLPYQIELKDGYCISVLVTPILFSVNEFNEENYYVYNPPEGTYVPKGVYRVGKDKDIPAGTYTIDTATKEIVRIEVFATERAYKKNSYDSDTDYAFCEDYAVVELEEGNVVVIDNDAIMKKQAKLKFD